MIDVGKGYRQLGKGELIQSKDQYYSETEKRWINCGRINYFVSNDNLPYRRPISQEKTENAE